jgi:hypothetical protein
MNEIEKPERDGLPAPIHISVSQATELFHVQQEHHDDRALRHATNNLPIGLAGSTACLIYRLLPVSPGFGIRSKLDAQLCGACDGFQKFIVQLAIDEKWG